MDLTARRLLCADDVRVVGWLLSAHEADVRLTSKQLYYALARTFDLPGLDVKSTRTL